MSWSNIPSDENLENHKYRIEALPRNPTKNTESIYDRLINIILDAKKDIKFHKSCETIEGAERYAKSKGLRAREHDLNKDGISDVIIYNRAGKPIMVNGYSIAPSEFPYRKAFLTKYPRPVDRLGKGGYKQWQRKEIWEVKDDFDEDGNREVKYDNVNLPDMVSTYSGYGYRKLAAPKRQQSSRQLINKFIAASLNTFIDNTMPDNAKFLKAVLPRFKLYSVTNDCVVDISFADYKNLIVANIAKTPQERHKKFKQFLAANKSEYDNIIKTKENRIKFFEKVEPMMFRFFGFVFDELRKMIYGNDDIPTDEQVEAMENSKHFILTTKDVFSEAMDKLKPILLYRHAYSSPLDNPPELDYSYNGKSNGLPPAKRIVGNGKFENVPQEEFINLGNPDLNDPINQ